MELQWPLILFTTLIAWSSGLFAAQGILAIGENARKAQLPALVASVALLALSGIAVFFHLEHWERIFNGFGNPTSGITQELIVIVAFAAIAIVYFAMLRRAKTEGTVPKWCAVLAIVISVMLAIVCAHSYMMAARPAWNSLLEIASLLGTACLAGPLTLAIIMAIVGDDVSPLRRTAIVGAIIGAVCIIAYALYLQASEGLFVEINYYFDPTSPTAGMTDVASAISSSMIVLWLGAVAVGAIAPMILAVVCARKNTAAIWKVAGGIAVACALIGAICLRIAFYLLGMSVYLLY